MPILPPFNDDCMLEIIAHLDTSSLATLSQTSKTVFPAVARHLVRNVSLCRDADQVISFCRFALSRSLARDIRHLHINSQICDSTRSNYVLKAATSLFPKPEYARLAGSLADIIEMATALECLGIAGGMEEIVEYEPRIMTALISNPPSATLRVSHLGEHALGALRTLRFPPNLTLSTYTFPGYRSDATSDGVHTKLLELLAANAAYLCSVDFDAAIYELLESAYAHLPLQFPNVKTITMPRFELSRRGCSDLFPNVRYFRNSVSGFTKRLEQGLLWPKLVSAEGFGNTVIWLAQQHPAVRRLHFSSLPAEVHGGAIFKEVCNILGTRQILSVSLPFNIVTSFSGDGRPLGQSFVDDHLALESFWPGLATALPHARFLSIIVRWSIAASRTTLEVFFAVITHETVASLDALPELRYLALRFLGYVPGRERENLQDAPDYFPTTEALSSLWFNSIHALEYLELDLTPLGMKRTWWRRQPICDAAEPNLPGAPCRVIRVSQEEGLSAREYFDWDGCR